jgi:HSP20 family protein
MASWIRTQLLIHSLPDLDMPRASWGEVAWQPRVDIYETPHAILIHVEAPGLHMENLRLHFEPGLLVVEGERERPRFPGAARAVLVEMNYGAFGRSFVLPEDVDGQGITATYDLGLLHIEVPRRRAQP